MAVALLAACNSGDDEIAAGEPVEIRLTSGLSVETRANDRTPATQFNSGEKVYVYVDETYTQTALYSNNELTADGSGGFEAASPMYYPQSGNNVDIYAAYPSLGATYPTTPISHTVIANQSGQANYLASDLLYAKITGQAKQSAAVNLTFYHQLAKVRIAIAPGAGLTSTTLAGATVKIINTKPTASWTPSKNVGAGAQTIAATGTVTDITTSSDVSSADFTATLLYNEAIIVPQTVAQNTNFIAVTLAAGGTLYYKLPAATTFESGKVYTYHITVNLTGLTVSSTISNWGTGGGTTGNATME